MDETSVQCIKEVRSPIVATPGQSERYDAEYERNGVAHLLLFYAPVDNWRCIKVANHHAACEWTEGVRRLVQVGAWVEKRNQQSKPADWRFTTEDARIKLKRLYPILSD